MSGTPTVKLTRPVVSVGLIGPAAAAIGSSASQNDFEQQSPAGFENQDIQCDQALRALETVTAKLQRVYEKMIVEQRQSIAKLSVEIARKILLQKVKDGDYQIESIIQEALKNAPTQQDIVVRLNPQDLAKSQQILQKSEGGFAGVQFIADQSVGLADCIVDTPKGKVESMIQEHLEQVARALIKAV